MPVVEPSQIPSSKKRLYIKGKDMYEVLQVLLAERALVGWFLS